jgi:integrase
MSKPKKKTIVRYELPDGKRCQKGTPGAVKRRAESEKYYARVTVRGKEKSIPLCAHYQASCEMLKRVQVQAAEGRLDIEDEAGKHKGKTFPALLEEWRADIVTGGTSAEHAEQQVLRCQAVFDVARWPGPSAVDAVELRDAVQQVRAARGLSDKTHAHYVAAVRQFGRWLADNNRAKRNPFEKLAPVKGIKKSRPRREFTPEELDALLESARRGDEWSGLTGEARAWLYLTAAVTGLRASELASMTPASFTWGSQPLAFVSGEFTKNKKDAIQPIPLALAEPLSTWIKACPAGVRVWPGVWADQKRGGRLLKRDARYARKAWLAAAATAEERAERAASDFLLPKNAKGETIDFHALRHTYISQLARSGVSPKVLMDLARHGKLDMSLGTYSHAGDAEKREGVSRAWGTGLGCRMVAAPPRSPVESGEVLYSTPPVATIADATPETPQKRGGRRRVKPGEAVESGAGTPDASGGFPGSPPSTTTCRPTSRRASTACSRPPRPAAWPSARATPGSSRPTRRILSSIPCS